MTAPPLHVAFDGSAGGILRQTLRLGRDGVLVAEDPLAWGPAPATHDLALWRAVREGFLAEVYRPGPAQFAFDGYAEVGLLMNIDRLARAEEIVVWAASGLPDQLNLAWTVFLCDRMGVDPARLRLVPFETLAPARIVRTIGELAPRYIRAAPAPRKLTPAEIDALRRAWLVYTSGDPADLAAYAAGPGDAMPVLHRALSALVLRYPDRHSGLGSVDERLLRAVAAQGPKTVRAIGHAMSADDSPDRQDYDHLFWRLLRMAWAPAPLVTLTSPLPRGAEVRLTAFGEAVLAGRANATLENRLDEWIGGVQLTHHRRIFRDGRTLLL